MHLRQGAGEADRYQPQRDHPPGGAGPPAARRRAADQPEPAGLPTAEQAVKKRPLLIGSRSCTRPRRRRRRSMPRSVAGQVGERYDGYVGVAAPVSATVRSQIATINIRRRSLYSNLAASRGASPRMWASRQAASFSRGCRGPGRICGTTAFGGAARQERPRPCLTTAAELRTNSGRPASSPKSNWRVTGTSISYSPST